MAKILVLYYSSYGHIERMAEAVAEGARTVGGTDVRITLSENNTLLIKGTTHAEIQRSQSNYLFL